MPWAWTSLVGVAFADFYYAWCSMGVIHRLEDFVMSAQVQLHEHDVADHRGGRRGIARRHRSRRGRRALGGIVCKSLLGKRIP